MDYWLKMLGGGRREQLLRNDWMNERGGLLLDVATFPRRPGIHSGDGIVYYGAGHRIVFAAGHVQSAPFLQAGDDSRWPWRVRISLPWTVEFIHDGVPLEQLNVSGRDLSRSIRQHSHIRLRDDEYRAAVKALGGSM